MSLSNGRLLLLVAVVLIGVQATIAQVILVRELLVVFYGNELCIGVILGAWLFGVALGAGLGTKFIEGCRTPQNLFLFLILALCMTLPGQVIAIRLLRFVIHVPTGQHVSILALLLASPLIIMPTSFVIGFIFPYSARVFKGFTESPATDIGVVYILESLGSLIGGVVFTFVLAPRASSFYAMGFLDCAVLTNLLLLSFFLKAGHQGLATVTLHHKESEGNKGHSSGRLPNARKILFVFSAVLLLFTSWLLATKDMQDVEDFFVRKRWQSLNPSIELLVSRDTRYQNIVVGKEAGQYSVYGSGQYMFSFPNPYEYGPIAHLVLLQHPNPKKVLLIGGGIGGLLSETLKYPLEEVHYVELDPKLLDITMAYLPQEEGEALEDARVKIFHMDGRYFAKQAQGKYKYDIVLINMPDPSTASLNRFYTLEFFRETKELLEPQGVLVTSISSAVAYIGEVVGNYIGSIYQTLTEVFPYVAVTPGQTNYYFASSAPDTVTTDIPTLTSRYKARGIQTDYFSEHHLLTYLQPEQVRFIERRLRSRKDLPLNTDSKPVTYFFNLLLWEQFAGGRLQPLLRAMSGIRLWHFFAIFGFFLAIRLLIVKAFSLSAGHRRRFNYLLAIATTGFAGIALEITLIFFFQNLYGYIYERIGLIVALFMMGLALGGQLSNILLTRGKHNWPSTLLYILIGVLAYALLLIPLLKWFPVGMPGSEVLFMLLVVVPGLLTGMEFPIASKLYLEEKAEMGFTAGILDSADHAGAFLGALLTGIVMLPVLGVNGTCWVIGAINGLSLILLLLQVVQSNPVGKVKR